MTTMTTTKGKVVLVGAANGGKSAILRRLMYKEFDTDMRSTIGMDFYTRRYPINLEKSITLQIWDTAGEERFKILMPAYLRNAQVAIIVFDLSSGNAPEQVTKWVNFVDRQRGDETKLILVGNKADLKGIRRPSNAALKKLTAELDVPYFETSALTGENIEELFQLAAQLSVPVNQKDDPETFRLDRTKSIIRAKNGCAC
ncbi:unnamed protein product, partial [Mesorhabditis spiculigera]